MGVLGLGRLSKRRGHRGGCLHGGDLLLPVRLFDGAQLVFHLHLEFIRGTTELADPFAQLTRQHWQLFWAEQQQRHHKQKDAVGKAWHTEFDDTASAGIAPR